jgi:uncharacterized protein YndB with AHSA1/START domain
MSKSTIVIERTYRAAISDIWDLWTTKEGFASWWGPQGFRADVHELDARVGGALVYDMVADSPEIIAEMKRTGQPISHPTRGRFTQLNRHERLVITHVMDFIPNVAAYEADIDVDFLRAGDSVRMVTTLHALHTADFSRMQEEGYTSQLTKLDARFAR